MADAIDRTRVAWRLPTAWPLAHLPDAPTVDHAPTARPGRVARGRVSVPGAAKPSSGHRIAKVVNQ